MIIFNKTLRFESGEGFKMYREGPNLAIYFSAKGNTKKVTLTDEGLSRFEIVAFSDEAIPIGDKMVYRYGNKLIIR